MAEELNEFQEAAEFNEAALMELSNAQARLRRLRLLESDQELRVVDNELQKVPRQQTKVKESQIENNAGGFVFPVSDETQVRRFLIIGSETGTYHQTGEQITLANAQNICNIIEKGNGHMVLRELSLINAQNRNPKMNSMLFTLAICARFSSHDVMKKGGSCPYVASYSEYIAALHSAALKLLPDVCRTPTHLFEFVDYCQVIAKSTNVGASKSSTGWGRSLRKAISDWYKNKTVEKLAMLLTKYPQREGWSHRDLFRLAHPNLVADFRDARPVDRLEKEQLFRYAVKGDLVPRKRKMTPEEEVEVAKNWDKKSLEIPYTEEQLIKEEQSSALDLVEAYLKLKHEKSEEVIVEAIKKHGLVREHLPTDSLNSKLVWQTLFDVPMPLTALIRNLGKMTLVGALDEARVQNIVRRLTDQEELRRARIHPINLLTARATYARGRGDKGSLTWEPNQEVCKALEAGFYKAFINAPKTGKRYCLALDVSGSMCSPVSSSPLSCREAATAMSLINLHNEQDVKCVAFCDTLTELPFTKEWTIDKVNDYCDTLRFGNTDCGLPMMWAMEKNLKFDVFIIYTDNDTWSGEVHPFEAIQKYREASGIHDAKVVVMGMQAYPFTIADPSDAGMMDIAGFDSAVPQILHEFVTGKI